MNNNKKLTIDEVFLRVAKNLYDKEIHLNSFIKRSKNIYTFYEGTDSSLTEIQVEHTPPKGNPYDHYPKIIKKIDVIDLDQKEKILNEQKEFLTICQKIIDLLHNQTLNPQYLSDGFMTGGASRFCDIPHGSWYEHINWVILLVTKNLYKKPQSDGLMTRLNTHYKVYFQQSELDNAISYKQNHHQDNLINLEKYSTPWLQVMNYIFMKHKENGLKKEKKETIENDMKKYIDKNSLKITKSNIRYLATFMRQENQMNGGAKKSQKSDN